MRDALLCLLVACCGDARPGVRDVAAAHLERAGPLALPALLWGVDSADPEIRHRCRPLLDRIIGAPESPDPAPGPT